MAVSILTVQSAAQCRAGEAGSLSVTGSCGIGALDRFAPDIDRLKLGSTRPNPFLSAAFLHSYTAHSEFRAQCDDVRLYLIHDQGRLIGCAPMQRAPDRFGPAIGPVGLRGESLKWLAPQDTEQPGLLSLPGEEDRVATALVRYLCDHERNWGMLDLVGQRPNTALYRAVHAAAGGTYRVRDIAVEPYNEVALIWPNLRSYLDSLTHKMRSNTTRLARHLYAAGEPELILANGPAAVTAWFDAYCELDGRSWKQGTHASVGRNSERLRFYREIAAGRGGLEPTFIGVLLDGVLVAGLLAGGNSGASPRRHGVWLLEMAYDRTRADLGAGNLLVLLAVTEALRRGDCQLNFMQNFAYYKHRWGADPVNVVSVQLIRRFGLHNARATMGDLKRRLLARKAALPVGAASRDAVEAGQPTGQLAAKPDTATAYRLAQAALTFTGSGVQRLNREQAQAYLPFRLH